MCDYNGRTVPPKRMALSVRSINCDASLVSPAGDVESLPLLGKQERSSSSSTSVRCRHDKAEDSKFFLVLVCIRTVVPLFLCATLLMINVVHTVHFLNKPSQVNNTCRHLLRNPNSCRLDVSSHFLFFTLLHNVLGSYSIRNA